ncbi:hypothetical protein CANCADRAFT_75471 [Tortispora caseinolytica NRRL Y-17796]|uniref:Cell division control protein 10 n=1 Tax=Tortispora caseinolytica NRRL Y-17796 TaxID=767744 RepID=A0A1E4TJ35_9ASCO|nr:hypothetical protein CANCADRAFT_75471 [Tortispora caseinolytica NRRL Y-17796]
MSQPIHPSRHVGFDSLPIQIEKKLLKRGFQFNLMVIGRSGLGKSTLINTLFASNLMQSSARTSPEQPLPQTMEIEPKSCLIEENNVRLELTCIDTPGFGDVLDNEKCWDPIIKYIKDQHSTYLRSELTAKRPLFTPDTRVHACLYFIQPTGKGLRSLDILVLRKLCEVVNVIPVIGKADALTSDEKRALKTRIREELNFHRLRCYPYDLETHDEDDRKSNALIRDMLPFAVVGSTKEYTVDGTTFLGRKTRWGTLNIEDPEHSEFIYLRDFLTRTHLQDLIDTTSQIHYETFRCRQLNALRQQNAGSSGRESSMSGSVAHYDVHSSTVSVGY